MSAWNWEGLDYVAKFNFMYLTEVCTQPGEKEAIYTHLRGLWEHLATAGIAFKAHWGKVNFIDPEFVRRNHRFDDFRGLISPMFVNSAPGRAHRAGLGVPPASGTFPGLTDIHAHPAMNAFLWDRDLRRHYFTGRAFNPLASLTDFKMLRQGGVKVLWSSLHIPEREFFNCRLIRLAAHFTKGGRKLLKQDAWECLLAMAAGMEQQVARADGVELAKSNSELDHVLANGSTAIVHTVEGGHVLGAGLHADDLEGRLARLDRLSERGVASLTLAHLFPNDLAGHAEAIPYGPAHLPDLPAGHRGGAIAGTHRHRPSGGRADGGAAHGPRPVALHAHREQEIYQLVGDRSPLVATHNGVQSMNPEPYNLDEDDVQAIAATGGVVGVIFMPHWLEKIGPRPRAGGDLEDHGHGARWSGDTWEHVAIGTDFDGFTDPPDDCKSAGELPAVGEPAREEGPLARGGGSGAGRQRPQSAEQWLALGAASSGLVVVAQPVEQPAVKARCSMSLKKAAS